MVDTKNQDLVKTYFDLVQDKIKKLISEDKEIKKSEIQLFNDEIFNQPDDIKTEISNYINQATMNNLDLDRIAKVLYDKFKDQVKNNIFNQTDNQNVPNPMLGEINLLMLMKKLSE